MTADLDLGRFEDLVGSSGSLTFDPPVALSNGFRARWAFRAVDNVFVSVTVELLPTYFPGLSQGTF